MKEKLMGLWAKVVEKKDIVIPIASAVVGAIIGAIVVGMVSGSEDDDLIEEVGMEQLEDETDEVEE